MSVPQLMAIAKKRGCNTHRTLYEWARGRVPRNALNRAFKDGDADTRKFMDAHDGEAAATRECRQWRVQLQRPCCAPRPGPRRTCSRPAARPLPRRPPPTSPAPLRCPAPQCSRTR